MSGGRWHTNRVLRRREYLASLAAKEAEGPKVPSDRRESWRSMAECRNDPGEHWWPDMKYEGDPEKGGYIVDCLDRCARSCDVCPVAEECLAMALREGHQDGIYSNTTPSMRNRMRRVVK